MTDGDSVAFSTISPNVKFYTSILYDMGADIEFFVDGELVIAGQTLFDMWGNNTPDPLNLRLGTNEWGEISDLNSPTRYQSLETGELTLIDFDSTKAGPYKVPFVETLTKDILSVKLNIPVIETKGKAEDFSMDYYDEGGFITFDVSEITNTFLNLVNAKLDYSPELKALYDLPSLGESSFDELIKTATDIFVDKLFDIIDDGESKGVPILLLDATDETNTSLLHINTFDFNTNHLFDSSYDYKSEITEETGSLGFYASYGESKPVVKVNVDLDQAAAVIINTILSAGATTATPTINPLNLKYGIEAFGIPKEIEEKISKYLKFGVKIEALDIDAYADAKLSQEFTLSVDDMAYAVRLEDNSIHNFSANDTGNIMIKNASSHDANEDGKIDYSLSMVPEAMFSNDTEIGMGVGYIIDFIKADFKAGINIPVGFLDDISLGTEIGFGPLLEIKGDFDVLDIDVYESRFDMNVGSENIELASIGINDYTMHDVL